MVKKGAGSMGTLTELAGSFSQSGLGDDMVGKFIPIVLEYAQAKGLITDLLKKQSGLGQPISGP